MRPSKDRGGTGSAGDDGSGLVSSLASGGYCHGSRAAGQGGELGLVRLGGAELTTAALFGCDGGPERPVESTAWAGMVMAAGEPDHRRGAAIAPHNLPLCGPGKEGLWFSPNAPPKLPLAPSPP